MPEEIINKYPNPWEFHNGSNELTSSDGENKIEYSDLTEIGMGAPLAGSCHWIDKNGYKTSLNKRFGGPPIWNTKDTKVAIPIWTRKTFKGNVQQIAILDITNREFVRYKKVFKVLHLRTFENNAIHGYDSPINRPKTLNFDLTREPIAERKKI